MENRCHKPSKSVIFDRLWCKCGIMHTAYMHQCEWSCNNWKSQGLSVEECQGKEWSHQYRMLNDVNTNYNLQDQERE